MTAEKFEIIYYEMIKMEKRLNEQYEEIAKTKDEISSSLQRFEILQRQLIEKLDQNLKS